MFVPIVAYFKKFTYTYEYLAESKRQQTEGYQKIIKNSF